MPSVPGWFPFAAAVEHLPNALANVARSFGVRVEAAGHERMLHRLFDAEEDRFGGKESFLDANRFGKWIAPGGCCGGHERQQRAPVHQPAA